VGGWRGQVSEDQVSASRWSRFHTKQRFVFFRNWNLKITPNTDDKLHLLSLRQPSL
jgi:hypothetical protein